MSYIKYPKPSAKEFAAFSSETAKYRHLTAPHCAGFGVDVASQGVPVVPWACSFDLPHEQFDHYANGNPPKGPLHLRGFADKLPFETKSLDWLYSSHLLEDFVPEEALKMLGEWTRCIRVGGNIIILVPDKELWNAAIAKGQPPNCAHKHEYRVGELTEIFGQYFGHFKVLEDKLTNVVEGDYSILFVAQRMA
jgi:hypothetical protein